MPDDIRKRPRGNSRLPSERDSSRATPAEGPTRNESAGRKPGRNTRPLITVFGSSRARRGDELYIEAWRMGQLLGQSGFDVATGGYSGVMEAVSRGAHEAGAHVVGVTMKPFGETVNPYVVDEIAVRDFYARLRRLVDRSQGYVVMRGGMGTLAELTFTWQKLWLKMLPARPCVLVGRFWRTMLDNWLENLTVEPSDYNCLTLADTPEQVCAILCTFFNHQAQPLSSGS